MVRRQRWGGGAGLVLALGIAVLAWELFAERAAPPAPHAEPGPSSDGQPAAAAHAAVLAPADVRPADHFARTPASLGEATRAAVRGRVVDPQGHPLQGAWVYAHPAGAAASTASPRGVEPPPPPPLAAQQTDAQGSYALSLPRRTASFAVDVHCVHPGFLRQCSPDIAIREGGEVVVDFMLSPGAAIRGWAVADGAGLDAVRGVPLVAMRGRPFRPDATFAASHEWDDGAFLFVGRNSAVATARASVRDDGSFEFAGLAPGTWRLLSADPAWLVSPRVEVAAAASGVSVILVPTLVLRLSAAAGSKPVAGFRATLTLVARDSGLLVGPVLALGTSTDSLVVALDRGLVLRKLAADAPGEGLRVRYQISAPSFADAHGFIDLGTADAVQDIAVDLTANAQRLCELALDIRYADGPWPREKELELWYAPENSTLGTKTTVQNVDGRWVAQLPEGRWWIRVMPRGPMGFATAVAREVAVGPAGGEATAVVLPRGGQLRILSARTSSLGAVLVGPNFARELTLQPGANLLEDLAPGAWRVEWLEHGVPQQLATVVTASGLAEIALPPARD
jgi:hypothetical protein